MQVEIKARDSLTELELTELENLSKAVYPPDMPDDGSESIEWANSEWRVMIRDIDDVLISYMGLITRQAKCDDTPVFMGGIGGVKTRPDARGNGYAGYGLKKSAEFLCNELKVDFSLLVCRDGLIPYYGKLGWQQFEGDMLVDQSSGKVKFMFANPMILAGVKPLPQCGVIDFCGKPW